MGGGLGRHQVRDRSLGLFSKSSARDSVDDQFSSALKFSEMISGNHKVHIPRAIH